MIFPFLIVHCLHLNLLEFIFQSNSDSDDGTSLSALRLALQTEKAVSICQVAPAVGNTEREGFGEDNATHNFKSGRTTVGSACDKTSASAKLSYISNVSSVFGSDFMMFTI